MEPLPADKAALEWKGILVIEKPKEELCLIYIGLPTDYMPNGTWVGVQLLTSPKSNHFYH